MAVSLYAKGGALRQYSTPYINQSFHKQPRLIQARYAQDYSITSLQKSLAHCVGAGDGLA